METNEERKQRVYKKRNMYQGIMKKCNFRFCFERLIQDRLDS